MIVMWIRHYGESMPTQITSATAANSHFIVPSFDAVILGSIWAPLEVSIERLERNPPPFLFHGLSFNEGGSVAYHRGRESFEHNQSCLLLPMGRIWAWGTLPYCEHQTSKADKGIYTDALQRDCISLCWQVVRHDRNGRSHISHSGSLRGWSRDSLCCTGSYKRVDVRKIEQQNAKAVIAQYRKGSRGMLARVRKWKISTKMISFSTKCCNEPLPYHCNEPSRRIWRFRGENMVLCHVQSHKRVSIPLF